MEVYIIDEEGNVKERYGNIIKKEGITIINNQLKFAYKNLQIPIIEQKELDYPYIKGDYVSFQNAPYFIKNIDLNKEKRVEFVF